MNLAHLHLLLNHVPTLGPLIGVGLFAVSVIADDEGLKRASLVILVVSATLALPAYMSGNAAREMIQGRADVSERLVARHQDAAALALVFVTIAGACAWVGLWQSRRNSTATPGTLSAIALSSVVTVGLMTRAAMLGGEIRHDEIRPAEAATSVGGVVSSIGSYIVDHPWVWPTCEVLHYIGLCLLLGTLATVHLRTLGFLKGVRPADIRGLVPWGMLGLGINIVTGMLFFIATPTQYTQNIAFDWKVVFLVLAGISLLYFTFDESWATGAGDDAPALAKVMAAAGIFLWAGVVFWGRMLPYLGNAF